MTELNTLKHTNLSSLGERAAPPAIVKLMAEALQKPDLLSLAAGFTSNALLPVTKVSKALEILNKRHETNPEHLQYGTTQGRPKLRQQITELLSAYPNESSQSLIPENVIVSNGSQQTLYLAIQVLCDPGDIVFVEKPSYFVFLELLKSRGVEPVSIPTTTQGDIDFNKFNELITQIDLAGKLSKVKACYLVSYFSNPSSHSVPETDKQNLGKLLKERGLHLPIIEDAAYRELFFETPYPSRSILSIPEMEGLPLLYTGTFTKPFASGMKIGYGCCTDKRWLNSMLYTKGHHDFGTANMSQAIIETVLEQNVYQDYLAEQRSYYLNKVRSLDKIFNDEGLRNLGWDWSMPEGGLFIWLKAPEHINTDMDSEFCKKALKNGVIYVPGNLCFAESSPHNYIRASFSAVPIEKMEEAGKRFVKTAKQFA